MSSHMVTLIFK